MKYLQYIFFTFLISITNTSYSQCAMCKAVVENGDSGLAKGLNDGIVTLMIIPYILVAIVAFVYWKYYKNNK
ncbi:hypothetical protein FHR24_002315 [Wenyingzhuangia heitensis]|uniref:Uncharacterized protein n=1 Tax=Wenyingzhuangia heitensis TaxID=1487859 RepID=A0ABX0UAJ4_9FLAO|nr:hypothetical protein [Wenyingzhuangia heitensis]NIJ45844.1 hypothetical protein [Wenyingzhuangia heitensis]